MPANVIKSDARRYKGLGVKGAENKWKKAKRAAAKQGHKEDWPYVQSIYQNMTQKYKKEHTNNREGYDMSHKDELRNFIIEQVELDEGLIRAAAHTAFTPLKTLWTGAKTIGRIGKAVVNTPYQAIKGVAKTAGNLATLRPGEALKSAATGIKKTVGAAADPAVGLAKDVGRTVAAPFKAARKGGILY